VGAVLPLAFLVGVAGCGESSAPSSSVSTSPSSPAVAGASSAMSGGQAAVAQVAGRPIAKASYTHWLAAERALGGAANAGHRALGFLLTAAWLRDEAGARGIAVSATEAKQRLQRLERQSFPRAGSLQKFLAKAHETEADLLERVGVELFESRIAAQVTAGQSAARGKRTLASFQQTFQRRWKSRTKCDTGYVMEDCSEYRGAPENLSGSPQPGSASTAAGAASGSASSAARPGSSASHSVSASSTSNASGEIYSAPGGMSISSPAFERNGAIPSQYTCDGADVSPPLAWQNVPAKAAALVLFVIDDSASGAASGIRWVVGDISPAAKSVAAGQTPAGGIVGSDTQGHSGYGGICPAHGKTSDVEFVLYALSKKIPLSPGFSPAMAESEYGAGKNLLLGSAAVTYAIYRRP
jgi:Raf kinase inhibitor-like YbhB/YbcL family protein